jgi:hypothetical protein
MQPAAVFYPFGHPKPYAYATLWSEMQIFLKTNSKVDGKDTPVAKASLLFTLRL